jgi:MFS family permease
LWLSWGGKTYPWGSSQAIGMMVAAIVLFLAFFATEGRVSEPILPLDLLRNATFTACSLLEATYGLFFLSVVFFVPLLIQAVLGQPATSSSAALAPLLVAFTVSSIVTGLLVTKIGWYKKLIVIGATFLVASALLLAITDTLTTLRFMTFTMLVTGIAFGMINNIVMLAGQNAVPMGRLGIVIGVITYLRTMGNAVGTAVTAALAINVSASQLASAIGREALANGMYTCFLVSVGMGIVMVLITLFLKDLSLSRGVHGASTQTQERNLARSRKPQTQRVDSARGRPVACAIRSYALALGPVCAAGNPPRFEVLSAPARDPSGQSASA